MERHHLGETVKSANLVDGTPESGRYRNIRTDASSPSILSPPPRNCPFLFCASPIPPLWNWNWALDCPRGIARLAACRRRLRVLPTPRHPGRAPHGVYVCASSESRDADSCPWALTVALLSGAFGALEQPAKWRVARQRPEPLCGRPPPSQV